MYKINRKVVFWTKMYKKSIMFIKAGEWLRSKRNKDLNRFLLAVRGNYLTLLTQ